MYGTRRRNGGGGGGGAGLEHFCRICIQTGVSLTDIDSEDEDSLKFSDKLRECTSQLLLSEETLSHTKICLSCIQKLRISYQFQLMCRNSNAVLKRYFDTLIPSHHATIKSPKPRRKRIGKDERCSLLKKLLCTTDSARHLKLPAQQQNAHITGLSRLCDRLIPSHSSVREPENRPRGLHNLLEFTRNYDFGVYDLARPCTNNVDLPPLDCLAKFTESFFYDHFGDYRDVILHIRDHVNFHGDAGSDNDESMFEPAPEEDDHQLKPTLIQSIKQEIVIVEPDLNFKKEQFYSEDYEEQPTEEDDVAAHYYPAEQSSTDVPNSYKDPFSQPEHFQHHGYVGVVKYYKPGGNSANFAAMSDLMYNYKKRRTLSPHSVKCRTRGHPFISPQLKNQFQMRDFKCSTCKRVFKSPGYLKAHRSKLRH